MLDKQYSRVIRWVNRAQTMSADGKFSDAILDVECARAELDDARQELLQCHRVGGEEKRIPRALRVVPAALVCVLFLAVPLGLGERVPAGEFSRETLSAQTADSGPASRVSVASAHGKDGENLPVSSAEKPAAERKSLVVASAEKRTNVPAPESRLQGSGALPAERGGKLPRVSTDVRRLNADALYRLTEVGRRALQKNRSGVVLEFN